MRVVWHLLLTPLSVLALLCLMQHAANASTITFNPLELPGDDYTSLNSYTELGFTFANLSDPTDPFAFLAAQQGNADSYAGSAGLFNNITGSLVRLSQGGPGFSLNSIDLSRHFMTLPGTATVTFTGNFVGGGTTVQTFTFSQFGFQTFTFNSTFSNLAFVDFGPQNFPFFQFDNVVVNASNGIAVPEPTTMLLLGAGLVGIAARVVRGRRARGMIKVRKLSR